MRILRPLIGIALCSAAAHSQEVQGILDRPVTLPRGTVELTLNGTYTNWSTGSAVGAGPSSLTGETLALGVDFGATDVVQFGVALALPINPGAAFGSVLGSIAFMADKNVAVRIDAGFENLGFNGDNSGLISPSHTSRYFGGIGAGIKVPISPGVAFVSGRTGAVNFGPFTNIGDGGTGLYVGASLMSENASDFLVVSGGSDNSGTNIGINLPAGLLLQADPHLAVTLLAGYAATIIIPSSGSTETLHFVPLALEAVASPAPSLDIGLRFSLDGYVAQTGGNSSGNPGYFDLRSVMLWFRVRA